MKILLTIVIFFTFELHAQLPVERESLSALDPGSPSTQDDRKQVDEIVHTYQPIIDHVQSESTLLQTLQRADQLTETYSDPTFLEPFLHPEKFHAKKREKFNSHIIYDIEIPWEDGQFAIGLYHSDVVRAGLLGAAWGLEWWLYYKLSQAMNYYFGNHLAAHANTTILESTKESDLQQPLQNIFPSFMGLIRTIAPIIAIYAILNIMLHKADAYYFPTHQITIIQKQQPVAISQFIPRHILNIARAAGTPQAWTNTINGYFKSIGWLPEWTEHKAWVIAKEMIILFLWLHWYVKNIIKKALQTHIKTHRQEFLSLLNRISTTSNQQEKDFLKNELSNFIKQGSNLSFSTWLIFKTTQLSVLQTLANIVISTPAWYRLGNFVYQTYKKIMVVS